MKERANKSGHTIRQFAGWCGLLLYVLAFSPVGMAVTSVLGTMDADHRAIFQSGADGMRLVLRHDGDCSRHQHHAVARVLTLFASPASAANPDHVLQFSSASGFTQDSELLIPATSQCNAVVVLAESLSFVAAKPIQFVPAPRPPPGNDRKLLCLHSTLLLI